MNRPDPIGPWKPALPPAERLAQWRGLRALVQVFAGSAHPLVAALARAEADPTDTAALVAWEGLNMLPARTRRNVYASLARLLADTPKGTGPPDR